MAEDVVRPSTFDWRKQVTEHLGQLITLGTAAIAVLRILVVSQGDLTTARAIVQHVSVSAILLDILMTLVISAYGAALVLVIRLGPRWFKSKPLAVEAAVIGILIGGLYLLPLLVAFIAVATSLVALAVKLSRRRGSADRESSNYYLRADVAIGIVLVYFIINVLTPTPWLPLEELKTSSGEEHVGYVLRDSDPLMMLTHDSQIITYPSGDVSVRTPCEWGKTIPPHWMTQPLRVLWRGDGYRTCDT